MEGRLQCGGVDLAELAELHGTPLYVYDGDRILARLESLRGAFAETPPLVAYSVKSNPNHHIIRLLVDAGAGADIVSEGELQRALEAGCPPERIVFAGVGKTAQEMASSLQAGIRAFHVESVQEMDVLEAVAARLGLPAPVGVRVNLDVLSPTHEYTQTGHRASKFGVAPDDAIDLYRRARGHDHIRAVGIDVHIGSQIRDTGPFLEALERALALVDRVEAELGLELEYLDLGGGYGVADGVAEDLDVEVLGARIGELMGGRDLELILEPGRYLVADAGCLLARVLYVKDAGGKTFVITDTGMTELIRPSHYGGIHPIQPVIDRGRESRTVDVVGPVCETGDFLARERELPEVERGDLLWVGTTGAYGFTMASNYNSRPRPAEVLVEGGAARLIRRRETMRDLYRAELEL
ncbi:MAG: diaminopimelate decarboxylase [Gemmatimonadetes bacterium]|nr:diaminopimelate decarboxylase [Gemmatimonadota bacterium]